jgi:flavorubredoxin
VVAEELRAVLKEFPIRTIAPSHGKIIAGYDATKHHIELVQSILAEIADSVELVARGRR